MKIYDAILQGFKNHTTHHTNTNNLYTTNQVQLAFHSSRIEGYKLIYDEIHDIFLNRLEIAKLDIFDRAQREELVLGHFEAFDRILETINEPLSIDIIKELHHLLMKFNFIFLSNGGRAGEFKHRTNTVGGIITSTPENVHYDLSNLLSTYPTNPTLSDISNFHFDFECIHPFQDGNGRTGRLIIFRECLKHLDKICIIPETLNKEYKVAFKDGKEQMVNILVQSIKYTEDVLLADLDIDSLNFE